MKKQLFVLGACLSGCLSLTPVNGQTYSQSSGTTTLTGEVYSSTTDDESVIKVTGGTLNLVNDTITKSGGTSDSDNSNFYGLNAAVLNYGSDGVINMSGGTITTSGEGANAFYAYEGSSTISDVIISCTANSSRGLFATGGGSITAENITATTAGSNSSVIATDRGGGSVYVTGGTYKCTGADAAVIYSTGTIEVSGITGSSAQGEIAVIEGSNSVEISDASDITSGSSERGIMALQSGSGDAEGSDAYFTINGGSLTTTDDEAPLIEVVTNATGNIYLNSVETDIASGVLMLVDYNDRWETNGATGNLYLNGEYTYSGDIEADEYSTANVSVLTGATLEGEINSDNTALLTTLTMDEESSWNVTGTSYINGLITNPSISDGAVTNITGNGYNVYYTTSTNSDLNSETYTLVGGGYLLPEGSTATTVSVTGVSLSDTLADLDVDGTYQLEATITPEDATNQNVSWSSSDESVASVDEDGLVTAVAEGSATITVTTEDGSYTASCSITVTDDSGDSDDNGDADDDEESDDNEESDSDTISVPFSYDGAGQYYWVTTQKMAYINSWCLNELTINGEDYTNIWSCDLPDAVDGVWVIYYDGSYDWSHFEAPQSAEETSSTGDMDFMDNFSSQNPIETSQSLKSAANESDLMEVKAYPNPFTESIQLNLSNPELVKSIVVIDNSGKAVEAIDESNINASIEIGSQLESGLYIVKIMYEETVTSISIIKN